MRIEWETFDWRWNRSLYGIERYTIRWEPEKPEQLELVMNNGGERGSHLTRLALPVTDEALRALRRIALLQQREMEVETPAGPVKIEMEHGDMLVVDGSMAEAGIHSTPADTEGRLRLATVIEQIEQAREERDDE